MTGGNLTGGEEAGGGESGGKAPVGKRRGGPPRPIQSITNEQVKLVSFTGDGSMSHILILDVLDKQTHQTKPNRNQAVSLTEPCAAF